MESIKKVTYIVGAKLGCLDECAHVLEDQDKEYLKYKKKHETT